MDRSYLTAFSQMGGSSPIRGIVCLQVVALLLAAVLLAPPAHAQEENDGALDVVGHTADGFYLDFRPIVLVELPRIFLYRDAAGDLSLGAFWTTRAAIESGEYDVMLVQPDGVAAAADEPTLDELLAGHYYVYERIEPAQGQLIADLSISRHLVFGLVAGIVLLILAIGMARRYQRGIGHTEAPRGIAQNMFEAVIVYVRDEIARPTLGDKHEKFLPYLLTAFFFILFCNLFGLVPFGGSATGNIAVTGVLAGFTFVIGQVYATKEHWKHLFLGPDGVPAFVRPILVPVEILGLFTRHAALAIRLFANMMAGMLVILSLLGIIFIINALFGPVIATTVAAPASVLLTVLILLIKLLVAFIQAYVFTLLSALFIGMSVEEHHTVEGEAPKMYEDSSAVTPGPGFSEKDKAEVERRTNVQPKPVPVASS